MSLLVPEHATAMSKVGCMLVDSRIFAGYCRAWLGSWPGPRAVSVVAMLSILPVLSVHHFSVAVVVASSCCGRITGNLPACDGHGDVDPQIAPVRFWCCLLATSSASLTTRLDTAIVPSC